MRIIKYKGKKFGKLIIIQEPTGTGNIAMVKAMCDCGKIVHKRFYMIITGNTSSCGCIKFTAGKVSKTNPLYRVYAGIRARCNYSYNKDYKRYGGRGIKLMWKSFVEFQKDMEKSYLYHIKKYGKSNTSIDRKDGNGDYSKENCKWSTIREQSRNRRTNKFLTIGGVKKTYVEWSREIGCSRQALRYRVVNGLKPNLILSMPFKYSNRYAKIV